MINQFEDILTNLDDDNFSSIVNRLKILKRFCDQHEFEQKEKFLNFLKINNNPLISIKKYKEINLKNLIDQVKNINHKYFYIFPANKKTTRLFHLLKKL